MTASDEALALTAAAAAALPLGDDDEGAWLAKVESLALALYRKAQNVTAGIDVLAGVVAIAGVVTATEEVSGRGVIHLHPSMGKDAGDPTADEVFRTPFLNEAGGKALFARARALVGASVRIGKYHEVMSDGRKVRMCAWIEPLSEPASARRPSNPRSSGPQPAGTHRFANVGQVMAAAREQYGLDRHDVSAEADTLLGPATDAGRSAEELTRLWDHLSRQFGRQAAS